MANEQNALLNGRQNRPNILSGLSGLLDRIGGNRNNAATPAASVPAATPTATNALSPQEQAFENFRNSSGYEFRLGQGQDMINGRSAAGGTYHSGAAEKALLEYGQNFASNEFGNYMGYLGNQQGVGLSAASAQAGVGQGYANSISGLNNNYANALGSATSTFANNASNLNSNFANNASGAYGNFANAQGQYAQNVGNINSNAAIANANNTNGMISGIGNALGQFAGAAAYRPYG